MKDAPAITIPFGGANFPKIKKALDDGYIIVGEHKSFAGRKVLLRKEAVKGDLLNITTYDAALYWMNGGFPTPDMYCLDKIKCMITPGSPSVVQDIGEKLRLGWCFLSCVPDSHYILCKPEVSEQYLCTEEDVKEYIAQQEASQRRTSGLSIIGTIKTKIGKI